MNGAVLEVDALCVPRGERFRLGPLSLTVGEGEWVGVVGANGCGKSTWLAAIAGVVAHSEGHIRIAGASLMEDRLTAQRALGFAVAPERLPEALTARQCLHVTSKLKSLPGIDPDLLDLAAVLGLDVLDEAVRTFSLGMRQKLAVLLALIGEPRLIVLDEIFNGLDAAASRRLRDALADRVADGASVLLATHHVDLLARVASRIVLLDRGHMLADWGDAALRAHIARGLDDALADRVASAQSA